MREATTGWGGIRGHRYRTWMRGLLAMLAAGSVVFSGSTPGGRALRRVAASDVDGLEVRNPVMQYVDLRTLIAIFTRSGGREVSTEEVEWVKQGAQAIRSFVWRHSRFRLQLDLRFVVVDEELAAGALPDGNLWPEQAADRLRQAGVDLGELDGVFVVYKPASGGGNFGGMLLPEGTAYAFSANAFLPGRYPTREAWGRIDFPWLFLHEFQHNVNLLYDGSGLWGMRHGDRPIAEASRIAGQDYDWQAEIYSSFDRYLELPKASGGRYGVLRTAIDRDADGIPDDEPRVPLDERRLGTNPGRVDSDGDGLSDLEEVTSGVLFFGSDPRQKDGGSPIPGLRFDPRVPKLHIEECPAGSAQPGKEGVSRSALDVLLGKGEGTDVASIWKGWTQLGEGVRFAARDDFELSTYGAWDDEHLYLGFQFRPGVRLNVELDLAGDGWWHGAENVELRIIPSLNYVSDRVMDASPEAKRTRQGYEVWRQGQLSEALKSVTMVTADGWSVVKLALPKEVVAGFPRLEPGAPLGLRVWVETPADSNQSAAAALATLEDQNAFIPLTLVEEPIGELESLADPVLRRLSHLQAGEGEPGGWVAEVYNAGGGELSDGVLVWKRNGRVVARQVLPPLAAHATAVVRAPSEVSSPAEANPTGEPEPEVVAVEVSPARPWHWHPRRPGTSLTGAWPEPLVSDTFDDGSSAGWVGGWSAGDRVSDALDRPVGGGYFLMPGDGDPVWAVRKRMAGVTGGVLQAEITVAKPADQGEVGLLILAGEAGSGVLVLWNDGGLTIGYHRPTARNAPFVRWVPPTVLPIRMTAGRTYVMKVRWDSLVIQAKVWPGDEPEPQQWQAVAENRSLLTSGKIGLFTNVPVTFDNIMLWGEGQ